MSSRSTKGENVSRGMGWNCIKENCGGIFELQQNKSGRFSPASGNR